MAADNGCIPRCAEHVEEIRDALIGTVTCPGFIHRTEMRLSSLEAPVKAREEISRIVVRGVGSKLLNAVIGAVSLGVGVLASYLWSHP